MRSSAMNSNALRVDICSLEADIAFFEARLSLAGELPDTAYQRAQIKTYQTLDTLLRQTLRTLKPDAPASDRKRAEPTSVT